MNSWLRRVRSAIGIGATWAIGWAVIGAAGVGLAGGESRKPLVDRG